MRLALIFAFQVLLVAATLAGITSFLFLRMQTQLDSNTQTILQNSLHRYENSLTSALSGVANETYRFKVETYSADNQSVSYIPHASAIIPDYYDLFSNFRRPLYANEFVVYAYEDVEIVQGLAVGMWEEGVCSSYACYRTTNDTALWIDVNISDGYHRGNFSNNSVRTARTFHVNLEQESYIKMIQRVPKGNEIGLWSPTYVWREGAIVYSLLTRFTCVRWLSDIFSLSNPPHGNGTVDPSLDRCVHSFNMDIDLRLLLGSISSELTTAASLAAVIDITQMKLISSTLTISLLDEESSTSTDNSTQTKATLLANDSHSGNESALRWSGLSTPFKPLNRAVQTFLDKCVASIVINNASVMKHITPTNKLDLLCRSLIARVDDTFIAGMIVVRVDEATEFLFVDLTPRAELYGAIDYILQTSVIVVCVISFVALCAVIAVFVAFSSAITTLIRNFQQAAQLQNDKVEKASGKRWSWISEVAKLHSEFLKMNEMLLQARAFFPQSLLQSALQASGDSGDFLGTSSNADVDLSKDEPGSGGNHNLGNSTNSVLNPLIAWSAIFPTNAMSETDSQQDGGELILTATGQEIDAAGILSASAGADAETAVRRGASRQVTFSVPSPSTSKSNSADEDTARTPHDNNSTTTEEAVDAVVGPQASPTAADSDVIDARCAALAVVESSEGRLGRDVHPSAADKKRSVSSNNAVRISNSHSRRTGLNLSEILTARRVTVVFGNTIGFHELCRRRGPIEAQRLQGALLGIVEEQAALHRGVIDSYHGDHVMLSFNASSSCMLHGVKSASMVLAVQSKVAVLKDNTSVQFKGICFGLSSGTAICGNYGTEQLRRFCVVSPVVTEAFSLMQHCRSEHVMNLVTPASFDSMKSEYSLEHRNFVILPCSDGGEGALISTIVAKLKKSPREPGDSGGCTSGEGDDVVLRINNAFELLANGEVEQAEQAIAMIPVKRRTEALKALAAQVHQSPA